MIMTIQEFVNKYNWKRIDYDWSFWFQCNDLTRQRLKESGLPQYKPLGNNWCKLIALNPNAYLVAPLRWVQNDLKKPNIRISFSHFNTKEDVDLLIEGLKTC